MKKINIISPLLALTLLFSACDEKEWVARDVELVPVYTLSNFTNDKPLSQDVYQTKSLMIEFTTAVQLLTYDLSDFSDNSTDTTYVFSYALTMDQELDNGVDTIIQTLVTRECAVSALIDSINWGTIQYIDHMQYDTLTTDDMETIIGSSMVIDTVFPPVSISVMLDEKYYVVE